MKKTVSICLIICIMLPLLSAAVYSEGEEFTDVSDHWAKDSIIYMNKLGIVKGVSDDKFEPESNVSRAEFTALVARTMNLEQSSFKACFDDVNTSDWYADILQTAFDNGIIDANLYPGGVFKPEQDITREEMTSIIIKGYSIAWEETVSHADISIFDDIAYIDSAYIDYVKQAFSIGFINGVTETSFSPKGFSTRAEAVTILKRLYDRIYAFDASTVQLPQKAEVAEYITKVNDYWIKGNENPGGADWKRSVYFNGNMAAYEATKDENYYRYAMKWADKNRWEIYKPYEADSKTHADNVVCGSTYIDLHELGKGEAQFTKEYGIVDSIQHTLDEEKSDYWWWIDAIYMAGPMYAKLGRLYNDERYFEKMHKLYTNAKVERKLFDEEESLWFRDTKFFPGNFKTTNGNKCFWSRGNGWVFAALAEILEYLPTDSKYRQEYIDTYKAMAKKIKSLQSQDGFWRTSLYDYEEAPEPETSGTAFFAYGLAWGINNGILSKNEYLNCTIKAWNALNEIAVREDGFLGYVQGVGDRPKKGGNFKDLTTDYGVGMYLIAGSEIMKLATGNYIKSDREIFVNMDVYEPAFEPQTEPYKIVGVEASETVQGGNPPEHTLDSNPATRWAFKGEQWICYDLGEVKPVSCAGIAFYLGGERQTTFSIEISEDLKTFNKVGEYVSGGYTDKYEYYPFDSAQARYVRINVSRSSTSEWNSIHGVKLYR